MDFFKFLFSEAPVEFIQFIRHELTYGDNIDRVFAIVFAIIAVVVVVAIVGMMCLFVDWLSSLFTPVQEAKARVSGRHHSGAMWIPVTTTVGKTTTTTMSYVPPSWTLEFDIGGEFVSTSVDEEFYDETRRGDRMKLWYRRGLIFQGVYITELARM